jgi:hypothetical protein
LTFDGTTLAVNGSINASNNIYARGGNGIYAYNGTANTYIYTDSTPTGRLQTTATSLWFNNFSGTGMVLSNANVGIGTTSPAYTLDVNGIANSTQSRIVGQGSIYIQGNSLSAVGYVVSTSSALAQTNFGTGDFTIELWVYPTATPATTWTTFVGIGSDRGGKEIRIGQAINGNGVGYLIPNNASSSDVYFSNGTTATLNTWRHVALVRSGTNVTMWYNGALIYNTTGVSFNFANTGPIYIGTNQYGTGGAYDGIYTGYISGLRIVKGTSIYDATASSITVPTTPFSAVTNTSILMPMLSNTPFAEVVSNVAFQTMGTTVPTASTSTPNSAWTSSLSIGIYSPVTSYALDVNGNCRLGGTSNSALIGSSTGLFVQGYAGADCYIRTNGGSGTQTGGIYFGAGATNTMYFSSAGSLSNASTTSNYIGGSTLSNSILTVGAATTGSTTSGSVNVAGGYFVNGVALATGGGSTISGTTTTGTVLLATGTSTGIQGNANMSFASEVLTISNSASGNTSITLIGLSGTNAGTTSFGIAGGTNNFIYGSAVGDACLRACNKLHFASGSSGNTTSFIPGITVSNTFVGINNTGAPATALDVNGGVTIRNGLRPLYNYFTGSGPITPAITSYGTNYYIINSAVTGITIPAPIIVADTNAYWVFRNATGSYLSITVTWPTQYYPTVGGTLTTFSPAVSPTTSFIPIPPQNAITIMFAWTSGGNQGSYCFAGPGTGVSSNLYAVF